MIQALTEEDAIWLAALHAARFDKRWSETEFRELFASGAFGWKQKDVGFLLLRSAAGETEILTLAVDAALQRRGIARALLRHAIASLATTGSHMVFLEVRVDNAAAQSLYRAEGFQEIARRRAYYTLADGSLCDAVVMQRLVG